MRMIAHQKDGKEPPAIDSVLVMWSISLSLFAADKEPRYMPRKIVTGAEKITSSKVAGTLFNIALATGSEL